MVAGSAFSLPYHEPSVNTILITSSFLVALNVANWALDSVVFCGLIGQILLGVIYGAPLASWLPIDLQTSIVQLGYLGLILLVYYGGLSTSLKPLLRNLPLSTAVAATGIGLPIGFSFLLAPITGARPLQCFTAGAALSATSLGTTFTILSSAGFAGTRLGVVLTSAAMMDDVVGLVMVQVVSSLGGDGAFSVANLARTIGASCGMIVGAVGLGWIVRYIFGRIILPKKLQTGGFIWAIQSAVLAVCVIVAGYAGASVLLGAFIAGTMVTWWGESGEKTTSDSSHMSKFTGIAIYEKYYQSPVERLLIPFFFASIGFSIPIRRMFAGRIAWRGIVYSMLMFLGKFITGIWILMADIPFRAYSGNIKQSNNTKKHAKGSMITRLQLKDNKERKVSESDMPRTLPTPPDSPRDNITQSDNEITPVSAQTGEANNAPQEEIVTAPTKKDDRDSKPVAPRPPLSLYPSLILGIAMVARGEIGFLIASIASANGIFTVGDGAASNDDLFLIVIWAVTLCTALGPLFVGLLVKRVKTLEEKREENRSRLGVLGEWSVVINNRKM